MGTLLYYNRKSIINPVRVVEFFEKIKIYAQPICSLYQWKQEVKK